MYHFSTHDHFHVTSIIVTSNHTLTQSNVILLAETKLKISDETEKYSIQGFSHLIRNDQIHKTSQRPHHGLGAYVKNSINCTEVQKYTLDLFESLYLCLHQHGQQNPVQVICIYVSPKCTWESLQGKY